MKLQTRAVLLGIATAAFLFASQALRLALR